MRDMRVCVLLLCVTCVCVCVGGGGGVYVCRCSEFSHYNVTWPGNVSEELIQVHLGKNGCLNSIKTTIHVSCGSN